MMGSIRASVVSSRSSLTMQWERLVEGRTADDSERGESGSGSDVDVARRRRPVLRALKRRESRWVAFTGVPRGYSTVGQALSG